MYNKEDDTDLAYVRQQLRQNSQPSWNRLDTWTAIMAAATIIAIVVLVYIGAL